MLETPPQNITLVTEKDVATLNKYADRKLLESTQLSEVMGAVPSIVQRGGIYLISAAVGCTAILLYFSKVPVSIEAPGSIIPEGNNILVPATETGVVTEVTAKVGQQLPKDATLLKIEPTNIDSKPVPAEFSLQTLQILQQKELEITREKIRLARLELQLKSQTKKNDRQRQQISLNHNQNIEDLRAKIIDLQTEIGQIKTKIENPLSFYSRKKVTMPEAGIVGKLEVKNPGQFISKGTVIAIVIPQKNKLIVQAIVADRDITSIKPGMKARIKIDAYNFRYFGTVPARVEQIIPNLERQGEFMLTLDLLDDTINHKGEKIALSPGLNVRVEIQAAEKRLLAILFSK